MKFLELHNNEWINLDHLVSFYTEDAQIIDSPYYNEFDQHPYGISFKLSGYEESSCWYKTKEERDDMVKKLKFHFGGWL